MAAKKKATKKEESKILATGDDALKIITNLMAGSDLEEPDDLFQAQDLMYEAWDTPQKCARIALAKKALKLSGDCADAYVLLGMEEAKTDEAALDYFRKGVEAGERTIGKRSFKEDVGHFWGVLETRPYMRARHMLAMTLCDLNKREEAVSHYQDMLRLNPDDNQGIRYLLMDILLILGKDKDAKQLHKSYKDDGMAHWMWAGALLSFREKGDSPISEKDLKAAIQTNGFVLAYLVGKKKLPKKTSAYMSIGSKEEAISYVEHAIDAWQTSPGALDWVANFNISANLK